MVRRISADNIRATVERLVSFGTRHTLSATNSETRGIGAARRWIIQEFERYAAESGGRLDVETQSFVHPADGKRVLRDVEIVNVIATLPGTNPTARDRVYLVTAHYDSRAGDPNDATSDAPGANDDASGVAAVMEMARVMSPLEFEATIVFALVAGEEQGLIGSRHMAAHYKRNGVNIAGMLTNDIIGNTLGSNGVRDRRHVRVFSEGVPVAETDAQRTVRMAAGSENDSPARQLARYVDDVAERHVPGLDVVMIYRRDRFLRGGDHTAFSEQGFPAVRFCDVNEHYDRQHQDVRIEGDREYGDLPAFVDADYVAQVTRVNAAALASLASAPAPPANARIVTAKAEHTTTLRWDANTERDLAAYEVVWRDTTAHQWQHVLRIAADLTEFTHPLSKDNYIFGLRAVDRDGFPSVVAYPRPARR